MIEGKWIKFILAEEKPKTNVWWVVAKQDNTVLGKIAWFARWRGYAFFPDVNMVFESTCLVDIAAFIEYRNKQQRQKRLAKSASV